MDERAEQLGHLLKARSQTVATAESWYTSDAYRPLLELRQQAATADAVFFDSSGAEAHFADEVMAEAGR